MQVRKEMVCSVRTLAAYVDAEESRSVEGILQKIEIVLHFHRRCNKWKEQ